MIHIHFQKWQKGEGKYNPRQIAILTTWKEFLGALSPTSPAVFDVARLLESVWDFSED
jgi:hypothetical protein